MPTNATTTDLPNTVERQAVEPPQSSRRPSVSECWLYTPDVGLQEVSLEGHRSTLNHDGQQLRSWFIVDRDWPAFSVNVVYSAEMPSRDVQDAVKELARERFKSRPWFGRASGSVAPMTTETDDGRRTAPRLRISP
jgi:hypothetical protein